MQVDVVLQSQHLGEEERTQQAARYGEDDGERKQEALVQGTQDEVNQQNTDSEDDRRVAAGLCFLPGDTVEVVAVTLRQYLGGRLLDGLDGIARRISVGCRSVHGDRAVHIETVQHFGAVYPLQIHELAQGSHFAAVGADEDVVERLGVKTVFRVGLDRHVVHFRETVDIRNVLPAVVTRKRREDRARRYAGPLGLRRVDAYDILREVDVEGRVGTFDLRALVQRTDELQVDVVEVRQAAVRLVLQVHGEAGRGSVTRDHRRCHGENLCVLDVGRASVYLADHGVHRIRLVRALFPVLELDDTHTVGGALAGDHTVTCHLHEVPDLGDCLDAIRNLLHDDVRFGERSTRSRGDVHHDRTLVFVGHQTRFGAVHQQDQCGECQAERRPHQPLVLDEEQHAVLVLVDQGAESRVECLAEAGGEVVAHLAVFVEVGFQDEGAQCGRERQGVQRRDTHGHGHRDTELRVEYTRRTAHHRHGDEHGHEDQRRGDDGRGDTRHGVDGSHIGGLISHVETRLDSLHHDNGVVDDRTDRKDEREERQQVDREARYREEGERTDQRYDDRNRGDKCRTDILQEDIDYEHHQEDGLDQSLDYLVDRSVEEVVHTLQVCDGDAFREFGFDLGQQGVDFIYDLRGVRTGGLEDHRADARMAVGVAFVGVGFASQLDVRDILQAQDRAVVLSHEYDLPELFRGHQTSAVFHRILECVL